MPLLGAPRHERKSSDLPPLDVDDSDQLLAMLPRHLLASPPPGCVGGSNGDDAGAGACDIGGLRLLDTAVGGSGRSGVAAAANPWLPCAAGA